MLTSCERFTRLAVRSLSMTTYSRIEEKLIRNFGPTFLQIINESNNHNVPKGSETHFKVIIVSKDFEDVSLLKRHRAVNDCLKEELAQSVHALSIVAKTPAQWAENSKVEKSPPCLGGSQR